MKILEANSNDIEKIYQLGGSVSEFDTSKEVVTFWPKNILQNCIESHTDWVLVAEENSVIIGFIICNYSPVFKKATIENIFVDPQHQRMGIGRKLLTNLLQKIESTDCENIVALINEDSYQAMALCQELGFNKGNSFVWMDKVLSDAFRMHN